MLVDCLSSRPRATIVVFPIYIYIFSYRTPGRNEKDNGRPAPNSAEAKELFDEWLKGEGLRCLVANLLVERKQKDGPKSTADQADDRRWY